MVQNHARIKNVFLTVYWQKTCKLVIYSRIDKQSKIQYNLTRRVEDIFPETRICRYCDNPYPPRIGDVFLCTARLKPVASGGVGFWMVVILK